MKSISVAFLLLFAVAGCDNPAGSSAGYDKDYQRQVKEYDTQTKITEQQLKKSAEQSERYEKLLERWEKQANRFDAVLEKWEKQPTKPK